MVFNPSAGADEALGPFSFFRIINILSICQFLAGFSTQGAKSLYLAKKRLEVTSPAIVVLNAFLDSSDLPKEGLSGLLWNFFWRDAFIRRYLDILFVIYS